MICYSQHTIMVPIFLLLGLVVFVWYLQSSREHFMGFLPDALVFGANGQWLSTSDSDQGTEI